MLLPYEIIFINERLNSSFLQPMGVPKNRFDE